MTILKFRSADTGSRDGTGSFTVTKPTGTADNDWLIAICGCTPSGGQTIALPAGYTSVYDHPSGYFRVGYKLAASEGASYSFSASGGSGNLASAAAVYAYSGGDVSKPPTVGVAAIAASSASVGGGLAALTTGAGMLMHIVFAHNSATSNSINQTAPYGMKLRSGTFNGNSSVGVYVNAADQYAPFGQGLSRVATLGGTGSPPSENIGLQLVIYQAVLAADAAPSKRRAILLEFDAYDEAVASTSTRRYSDFGVKFTDGVAYPPRIVGRVQVRQDGADSVGVGGRIATTVGRIVLDNRDGALDAICERALSIGRPAVVKAVEISSQVASDVGAGASSSAATVFTGVVGSVEPDGVNVVLSLSDKADLLSVPLQDQVFSGGSGLGGGAELENVNKPITVGRVYNIFPTDLGSVNLGSGSFPTYAMNSGPVNNTRAVRIRGVAQTEVAVAPAAGEYLPWDTESTGAVFQLGATPDGVVTCDLSGDDPASDIYANQTGEVLTRLLTGFGGTLAAADLESSTFSDADVFFPGEIGWHMPEGSKTTVYQAVDEVLRHGAVWLSGGRNGKLRAAIASPGPAEKIRLRQPDVLALLPVDLSSQLEPAPRHVDVRVQPNWYPIDDIATSVSGTTRQKLSSPGQYRRSTSSVIQTRQLPERTWTLPGLFFAGADAQTRADQLRLWVEMGLRAVAVTTDRYRNRVELGMLCEVEGYPRYGLEGGFSGIVASWAEEPATGRVEMVLIGATTGGLELREDGGYELREDGGYELRE